MKKCFLLISIILVAFGFSLNSSVISNSFENNNTNTNCISTNNTSSLNTIPSTTDNCDIDTVIETYPASGTMVVHYTITNSPGQIDEITWLDSSGELFEGGETILIQATDNEEYDNKLYTYDGYLTTKDGLEQDTFYNGGTLFAQDNSSDKNMYESEKSSLNFTIPIVTGGSVDTRTEDPITPKTYSAEIKYVITPAVDKNKVEVTPKDISWYQENDNKDEEDILLGSESVGTNYSDSLSTDDVLIPNTTYENTYLKVTDELNYEYESLHDISFTTNDIGNKETTINADKNYNNKTVYDIDEKEASIKYTIDLGTNDNNEKLSISKVEWYDENDNLFEGATSTSNKTNGTLTATNLIPGTPYKDTYLKVTMSDDSDANNKGEIEEFNTDPGYDSGTITTDTEITDLSAVSATVNYEIDPAKNVHGKGIQPTEIDWVDINGNSFGTISEEDKIPPKINKETGLVNGSITVNSLNANDDYPKSYLIVEDENNQYNSKENPINEFTTLSMADEGVIKNTTTPTNVDEDYAIIDYTITLPTDASGGFYPPTSVTWINPSDKNDGKGEDLDPQDLDKETTEIFEGEIRINDLTPGTNYENTYLVVNDETNNKYDSKNEPIPTFKTDTGAEKGIVFGNEVINKKGTSATLKYEITPELNEHAKPYKLTKITWIDENNKAILAEDSLNITPKNREDIISGEITTNLLDVNTEYNKTYLEVTYEIEEGGATETFSTKNNKKENDKYISFESGNFKTKKTILGSSILGIFVVIFAVIGFFFWAYKKRRRVN